MKSRFFSQIRRAFTLIELLIVVAIIAILAAIAVPNFLEAQTRAKVGRALADMRTIITAIESYAVDNNKYPAARGGTGFDLIPLTTPIAYITSFPNDVFKLPKPKLPLVDVYYDYVLYRYRLDRPRGSDAPSDPGRGGNQPLSNCLFIETLPDMPSLRYDYLLFSAGPDRDEEYNYIVPPLGGCRCLSMRTYDPTNGTVSSGDIFKTSAKQLL